MNIGVKIKELRLRKQLTQEELADRAELSKGFISQIENDLTSPSIASLVDILLCLGSDLKEFFSDSEDKQVVFKEEDYFLKEDSQLKSQIEWVIPNAQKNAMEPIRMTIMPGGTSLLDQPHEGEEFGFVISGEIEVRHGKETYKAIRGESFYFIADKPHFIKNIGPVEAVIIWVSTPPSF